MHEAKKEVKERIFKDTLPIHILPIQCAANPRVQVVISKNDELQNSTEVSLTYIDYPSGELYQLVDRNYKVSQTRQQILEIHMKLT